MSRYQGSGIKLTDGRGNANSIFKFINALQLSGTDVYVIGVQKGTYTVNAGTWNIDYTGFTGLTVENFPFGILNLTTDEIYSTVNATITSTQIQLDSNFNIGRTPPASGDLLFIPVVQDIRAYDDTNDVYKVIEQSPLDQQILEEKLLDAVTTSGASSDVYVLDKKQLTVCIVASGITSGATFTFQASPDQSNYGTVSSVDNTGNIKTTQTITANGTYFFEIVNASSIKWFRANITSYTDGTYTCYVYGRA